MAEENIFSNPPERKLPWILDIFLYPTSMSGLINLGIFWIVPVLLGINARLPIRHLFKLLTIVPILFIGVYMYYYFKECIRDSALGEIRAPENADNFLSHFSFKIDL